MQNSSKREDQTAATSPMTTEERGGPGLRDAADVLSRVEADEAAAAAARAAAETNGGLPVIDPDEAIQADLRADERVHAMRPAALLNQQDSNLLPGYAGRLYLTNQRLAHVGQAVFSVALNSLDDVSVVGERLLVTLTGGDGISFDVAQPRLLRAQIGIARKVARG